MKKFVTGLARLITSLFVINVPILFSYAYVLNWHIGLKILFLSLLVADYCVVISLFDEVVSQRKQVKELEFQLETKTKQDEERLVL